MFILWHFAEAAANLLTNDALDPQALIPARQDELANLEVVVRRGMD